jgi:YfiH family protein
VVEVTSIGTDAPHADASFTTQPGVVCAVLTADCLPVLITDQQARVIAAVHAGWRGLAQRIISATVQRLAVPPAELLVWLGPAIGPQAFEVGADVHAMFTQLDPAYAEVFIDKDPQHWWMNAYAAARLELQQAGVGAVWGGEFCTYHDNARFYSYRRDGVTGRMASLIWLEP